MSFLLAYSFTPFQVPSLKDLSFSWPTSVTKASSYLPSSDVMESGMSLADVSVVVAGSLVPASVSPPQAASPRTITEAKRSARIFFILFISSVSMDWFGCVQGIFLQPFNGIITLIYPAIKSANETPSLFDKIDNLLFPCSKAARQKLHCAREYAIMFW